MKRLVRYALSIVAVSLLALIGWEFFRVLYLPLGPDDGAVLGWATARNSLRSNLINDKTPPANLTSFEDFFMTSKRLDEGGSMSESENPSWWLNSGGLFVTGAGVAKTVQGDLPVLSRWRVAYALSNPEDTDNGYHPQNIFRLVLRSKWTNFIQESYMYVNKDNLSDSPNRNASNGLLLFNRYVDGQNLYYTGIRVDGAVVIKKKINGTYYTMAYQKILPGTYNHDTSPNLLPKNQWMGIRSSVKTLPNGTVEIRLYTDMENTGEWTQMLVAIDDNKKYGGNAITSAGYAGIRTDFMDVSFKAYKIEVQ